MDPITEAGDHLPAPSADLLPTRPPHFSSQQPHYVYIISTPDGGDDDADGGGNSKGSLVRLLFVAAVMAGAAVLLALGHPAEAVVAVLLGSGLAAVEVLKALKRLG